MKSKRGTCVEIDGVFYESCRIAGRILECYNSTISRRCLSVNFPNYKIVPFRITYTGKKCTVCGKIKLLKEFNKRSDSKDGRQPECRECQKKRFKKWEENNPEWSKAHYQENKEKISIYVKKHNSQLEVKTKRNKRLKKRRETDIVFKVNGIMSCIINKSLKDGKNGRHWESLVDYTSKELIIHFESLFTEGMSWDNWGYGNDKWNLEHRKSKKEFNITSTECQGFRDYWALPNLQPMWQLHNFRKGTKPMHPKYLIKPF